ncbi:minor outer capsid protein P9 [Bradyrhizobium oligotrophicum S58]|uniref:Minor outer capsid protein P9 n=1 Tax=Bradyrhizobium oligotrophicum S58 TaxID=1245469 RepID=M4Z2A2_9BRAD|nr:minor outer capsid protein P9 [Bradyrhizobium oligotrophicum S58]
MDYPVLVKPGKSKPRCGKGSDEKEADEEAGTSRQARNPLPPKGLAGGTIAGSRLRTGRRPADHPTAQD